MMGAILQVENLTVSFDGFKAIDDLSLSVEKGSIRVLIGPNGAGKSTLCDTIIGKVRPSAGRVLYAGKDVSRQPEHQIVQMGVCRKFQTPGVLENLSVENNLAVAVRQQKSWWTNLGFGLSRTERERLEEILELVSLKGKREALASSLAHGEKQWLELGMVVAADPELLLLDEPTAGMTTAETAKTAELILRLAGRHTVLVIDHDMHFVELMGVPISVLHMGRLFKEGDLQTLRDDPGVIEIYLGRAKEN